MKSRFEEHDNQLFRMLDKPVPCQGQLKWNYIAGIVHDKPLLIRDIPKIVNPRTSIKTLNDLSKVKYVVHYDMPVEIIGIFVEEGSKDWALYQMMQGKKVSHKDDIGNVYRALNQDGDVQYYDMDDLAYVSAIRSKMEFDNHAVNTGWQIYKEPEQPKYKVGDWVRGKSGNAYEITAYPSKLLPNNPNVYDAMPASCMYGQSLCLELSDTESKLSPSEVIVKIGCLSGTVRPVSTNGIHIWFHLIGVDDKIIATIRISSLDKETSELVESLLEAQEEKC